MPAMKFDVFDLDGTIFPGNTFHRFSWFIIRHASRRADTRRGLGAIRLMILRGLGRISHGEWKQRLLHLAEGLPNSAIAEFAGGVATRSRPRLSRLLDGSPAGCPRILATAAPEVYAALLGPMLGFSHVVSSRLEQGVLREAKKELKRDLVIAYSTRVDMDIGRLFTDHHDDMPLAAVAERCFLVNPSNTTLTVFERARIRFDVFRF